MKPSILVVSQYFYPEEFRINDICKEWVRRGYQVTVVTGIPNYPQGRFFRGYGWLKRRREVYEGIQVIRLPIVPRGKNPLMLVLNYFSFVVSGFFWQMFTKVKADKVFMFEVSPMTQALVGVWYAKRRRIPCYLYVQDLWPENVVLMTGLHYKAVIGPIDKMVNYIYRNCSKIFATSPGFVKKLEERQSVYERPKTETGDMLDKSQSKVLYWPQYAEKFYRPVDAEEAREHVDSGTVFAKESFKIVFTGNIGYAQGLDVLPKVAAALKAEQVSCVFYIIGDGRFREELEKKIEQKEVSEMFCLLGRKQPQEIPYYMAFMDIAFLSFADAPLFELTIPAKLQSYMACGIPVLAAAKGESERIIKEAKCGLCCEMGNVKQIKETIIRFMHTDAERMREMAANAREYSERNFSSDQLLNAMEQYMA